MPLQMQLSPLWAGLAVYSSKIINDKKEVPEYTSGISFFAVIYCKKSLFQGSVQYLTVIPGFGARKVLPLRNSKSGWLKRGMVSSHAHRA